MSFSGKIKKNWQNIRRMQDIAILQNFLQLCKCVGIFRKILRAESLCRWTRKIIQLQENALH